MGTSRHAHPDDFFRLAEEFSRRELERMLGVDRATLRRWREGKTRIPWAAFQLVHERSRYGLAERDSAEHFNRVMLMQLVDAQRAHIARLEADLAAQARLIDWGCANDPFIQPGDPRAHAVTPIGVTGLRRDDRPARPLSLAEDGLHPG